MHKSVEEIKITAPTPGSCPVCATVHGKNEPHDLNSLYYQNRFFKSHKRFPTWADALQGCSPEVRNKWKTNLKKAGIEVVFPSDSHE